MMGFKTRSRCGATQKGEIKTQKGVFVSAERGTALRHWPGCSQPPKSDTDAAAHTAKQEKAKTEHPLTFSGINRIPGCCHRAADAEKSLEQLRWSPYCCCYLGSRCVRIPCIIDDSQQSVRECRQMPSAPPTGRDRSITIKKKEKRNGREKRKILRDLALRRIRQC